MSKTVKTGVWIIVFCISSCTNDDDSLGKIKYIQSLNDWHTKRIEKLKQPDSWLSLTGLYWLEEGENSFGSAADNKIQFPEKAAPHLGIIKVNGKKILYINDSKTEVLHEGSTIKKLILKSDHSETPSILTHGNLSWYIIARGERFAIRLKDSAHPAFNKFGGIDRFPVDPAWRIPAKFEFYDPPKKISAPNILGMVEESLSPGALVFKYKEQTYRLDPLGEPGGKQLFILFSDMTSGKETYSAGRFLYVNAPDEDGHTFIDFNKSYNPPCAFTEFATCPLPPRQNWLTFTVTAGEKDFHIVSEL